VLGVGLVVGGLAGTSAAASGPSGAAVVSTVASGLRGPTGLALDSAGDLFIADTDQCRVLMLASHPADLYGHHERPGRLYDVAGSRCGSAKDDIDYPTSLAVNASGDLFIAETTADRVVMVPPAGSRTPIDIAGTGMPGYNGDRQAAPVAQLDQPSGLAVDRFGDLFIADTANCRVREVPAVGGTQYGQAMLPLNIYTVAGTGVCGAAGLGGPAEAGQLWDPAALTVDSVGDLFITDPGNVSVLEVHDNQLNMVVGGTGTYQPYLTDGLPAISIASELNDPEGIALGPDGALYISDTHMRCIRVVPTATTSVFGRSMTANDMYTLAGALPVATALGTGDGTQWILTHLNRPFGIVVAASGRVYVSDQATGQVRSIGPA
jgi:sugar lactone lactonase YvrE